MWATDLATQGGSQAQEPKRDATSLFKSQWLEKAKLSEVCALERARAVCVGH